MRHATVQHAVRYVDGLVHTNTIEGFWGLLKRAWYGQDHHYSREHSTAYVVEACYKYNTRFQTNKFRRVPSRRDGGQMNRLYYGDCLSIMQDWPMEYVDLIYLDPPFNSNRQYNAIYQDETRQAAARPRLKRSAICGSWMPSESRRSA